MTSTFPPLSQSIITTGDWVEPSSYNELFRKTNAPPIAHLMPTTRVMNSATLSSNNIITPNYVSGGAADHMSAGAADFMPVAPDYVSAPTDFMPAAPPPMDEDDDSDSDSGEDSWHPNNLVTTIPSVAFSTSMYPMEVSSLVVPQS